MKVEDNLDKLDAEFVEETLGARGYGLIKARIELAVVASLKALQVRQEHADSEYRRGVLAGLETALQIPQILIDEGRQK